MQLLSNEVMIIYFSLKQWGHVLSSLTIFLIINNNVKYNENNKNLFISILFLNFICFLTVIKFSFHENLSDY